jgi:hypothetical protein
MSRGAKHNVSGEKNTAGIKISGEEYTAAISEGLLI